MPYIQKMFFTKHSPGSSRTTDSDSPSTGGKDNAPTLTIHPDRTRSWLGRFRPVIMAHKGLFFFGLACSLLALTIQVSIPRILMMAVDQGLLKKTIPLFFFFQLLASLALFRGLFQYLYRSTLFRAGYAIESDLRTMIFNHIISMSSSFFDRIQSGQLISRANSDIRVIQMFLVFGPFITIYIFTFFIAFGLMLTIHVLLAFVALIPLPLVYLIARKMRKSIFPASWIVQSRLADLATMVDENVSGVRVVKSFAAEKSQIRKLTGVALHLRWAAVRLNDIRAMFSPVIENLPRLAICLVLLYGGYLALRGKITIGALLAFSSYVIMLQAPFQMLGFLITFHQRAQAAAERVFQIFDQPPEIVDRPGAVDLVDPRGEIEFRDVSFVYGANEPVLSHLNLKIAPGEKVALVGRTGSGKTTMARLLTRFYDVSAGSILIDGHDIRELTLAGLRRHIGYALDEPILFSATIRENIAYGRPEASLEEVEMVARIAGVHDFIRDLPAGYDTVVGERGYTLSGGQRQRIALAGSLISNRSILILDDALSSVDVNVEQKIHQALTSSLKDSTCLIIAHRLSTLRLADRVIMLDGGRVAAQGRHEDLMQTDRRYAEIITTAEEQAAEKGATAPSVQKPVRIEDMVLKTMETEFKGVD